MFAEAMLRDAGHQDVGSRSRRSVQQDGVFHAVIPPKGHSEAEAAATATHGCP